MILICPRCRRVDDAGLHVGSLVDAVCQVCAAVYPTSDGVHSIFRESPPPPGPPELTAIYARSRHGPLQDWLGARIPAGALELGSGLGYGPASVLLDQNLAVLLASSGVRIHGDLLDPPFLPESYTTVVLANVLDSVSNPLLAMQQAVALLAPGGELIVSCAFAFAACITPPEQWFDESLFDDALGAVSAGALVESERLTLDWPLRVTERLTHTHRVDVRVWQRRCVTPMRDTDA